MKEIKCNTHIYSAKKPTIQISRVQDKNIIFTKLFYIKSETNKSQASCKIQNKRKEAIKLKEKVRGQYMESTSSS